MKLNTHSSRPWQFHIVISLTFCSLFFPNFNSYAVDRSENEIVDSNDVDDVYLLRSELVTIKVNSLTKVSITDPDIADITNADSDVITVIGKAPGQTTLFIWDVDGKRSINIHVSDKDLRGIESRIRKLLDSAIIHEVQIEADPKEGKVILSGEIPESKEALFDEITVGFPDDIINLVKTEEIDDLIQIDMQIAELDQTLDKALGIDWGGISLTYPETLPSFDGSVGDFFKIGDFSRTTRLQARVDAIINEGKGRILSKPKLVVESGEEANFLVGGEIPIRTTSTTTSGGVQENVSFKEYGVGMTITPTVKRGKKIEVKLTTEISDIDSSVPVANEVAFKTRSAQTQVLLDDGQTAILAGLIKSNQGESTKRVPFFSSVPIVGALFRHRSWTPNTDSEVVISLTPRILSRNRSRFVEREEEKRNQEEKLQAHSFYKHRGVALENKGPLPMYAGIPPEMSEYVRNIQQKISESIVYPKEAREQGWQGTVKLGMLILSDGTLAYALVKETSGFDLFDKNAVEIAKNVAPYQGFPANTNLQELNITIPIVYTLKRN